MRRFDPTEEFLDIQGDLWLRSSDNLAHKGKLVRGRLASVKERRGAYIKLDLPPMVDYYYYEGAWLIVNLDDTLSLVPDEMTLDPRLMEVRVASMMTAYDNVFLRDLEGVIYRCRFKNNRLKLIFEYDWEESTHADLFITDDDKKKYTMLLIDNNHSSVGTDKFKDHREKSSSVAGFRYHDHDLDEVKLLHGNAMVTQSDKIFLKNGKIKYLTTIENIRDIISQRESCYVLDGQGKIWWIDGTHETVVHETIIYENKEGYNLVRFCNNPEYDQSLYVQDSDGHVYQVGETLTKLDLPERSMHLYPTVKRLKSAANK